MSHALYRVIDVQVVGSYQLKIRFDDDEVRTIDFRPVLEGEMYGPLKDEQLFNQVAIDPEVQTLVWPNGADFDPETLHDWHQYADEFQNMARRWKAAQVRSA